MEDGIVKAEAEDWKPEIGEDRSKSQSLEPEADDLPKRSNRKGRGKSQAARGGRTSRGRGNRISKSKQKIILMLKKGN